MSKPMNFISNGELPDSEKRVLIFWKTRRGLERISAGFYAAKLSIEVGEWDEEDKNWLDFDENETAFLPTGWYESGWETEQDCFISDSVIGWCEMPDFPDASTLTDRDLLATGRKTEAVIEHPWYRKYEKKTEGATEMNQVFISRHKASHAKRRKQLNRALKDGLVSLKSQNSDGWLYLVPTDFKLKKVG